MNVLIVVPGGVHSSGEYKVIPALLSLLDKLSCKHKVYVIALNQTETLEEYTLCGCQIISLPKPRLRNIHKTLFLCIKRLKFYNFIPHVIHGFWLGQPSLIAALLSLWYRVKLVATIGGGEPVSLPDIGYGGSQSLVSRLVNWFDLKVAHTCTCGSIFVQKLSMNRWNNKPILVPLGIDVSFWSIKKRTKRTDRKWQLIQLASINLVKDPKLLLDVVQQLKHTCFDFHLNWVGQDTMKRFIHQKVKKLGLEKLITFHGFKTQEQLKEMLKEHDFIVQTSRYESQGIALIEACSQGVCPVGTSVGWLDDMGFGISKSKEAPAKLIAEEIIFLSDNEAKREARIDAAQEWISHHDVTVTAQSFDQSYSELIENNSKPII